MQLVSKLFISIFLALHSLHANNVKTTKYCMKLSLTTDDCHDDLQVIQESFNISSCANCEMNKTNAKVEINCNNRSNRTEDAKCPSLFYYGARHRRDETQNFHMIERNTNQLCNEVSSTHNPIAATGSNDVVSKTISCEKNFNTLEWVVALLSTFLIVENIIILVKKFKKPKSPAPTEPCDEQLIEMQELGEARNSVPNMTEVNDLYSAVANSEDNTTEVAEPLRRGSDNEPREAIYADNIASIPDESCFMLAENFNIYERLDSVTENQEE
ncbi:uncharacterized protein LOC132192714 [Neocloeon triangulifer]|uniref:uncharacterized protein LOC132192714 n=1 Tax=Neocloeon triangulifer TaxID=2078957 RepID=UPI00286F3A0F|nr:uncharacterized protein LOC132192714 [Neocloeon triangulifer]